MCHILMDQIVKIRKTCEIGIPPEIKNWEDIMGRRRRYRSLLLSALRTTPKVCKSRVNFVIFIPQLYQNYGLHEIAKGVFVAKSKYPNYNFLLTFNWSRRPFRDMVEINQYE